MWTYSQSSGELTYEGNRIATGYSGHGTGRDNPDLQNVHDLGPCPRGRFKMEVITDEFGNWIDYERKKAPVLRLIPQEDTEMFGRVGMLIHGDSVSEAGAASLGCIVQSHWARVKIAESNDMDLAVTI